MLTLALHAQGYAAYDTEQCGLYKVWQGGIQMEGVAYTNVKNLQPSSWGNTYWEDADRTTPWRLKKGEQYQTLKAHYLGYHVTSNLININYELITELGEKIRVSEQPDMLQKSKSKIVFHRHIQSSGIPEGTTLYYRNTPLQNNRLTKIEQVFAPIPSVNPPSKPSDSSQGKYWLDRSGCNTCHEEEEKTIGPGLRQIAARYQPTKEVIQNLSQKVKSGGSGVWGEIVMTPHPHLELKEITEMVRYILSLKPSENEDKNPTKALANNPIPTKKKEPGFGFPLEAVHPSFDLITFRPAWFKPRVGAMDFTSDGRLVVTTWDSLGAVYLIRGVETGDSNKVEIKRIASGLGEPLGIKVVDQDIFVLQKQELTQLIDHNGDDIIDEYRNICNSWGATTDFHEFACGLVYQDGYFYATLGLAMRLLSHETQHPDRGTAIKISRDGKYSIVANGLRQANGIGLGIDGEIFITENQGQWVPANKVIHLREGDFHGCQFRTGHRHQGLKMTPPAVWLPQDDIGNSPSQPVIMKDGPYAGQMLHGEVTHGGIKRVFLEKVDGSYQGCVFRFTQGLEAGVNRLVWGPDGRLYVGGIGMVGNWGWQGKQYGLQALSYNGTSAFEILAVRIMTDGLEVEFTEPLAQGQGELPGDYPVQQWRYEPTAAYGGPKLDLEVLPVRQVVISKDRRKARLFISGCKEEHVIYIQLSSKLASASGKTLWSGDCWYTMNSIPAQ
jgi:cytochrome c